MAHQLRILPDLSGDLGFKSQHPIDGSESHVNYSSRGSKVLGSKGTRHTHGTQTYIQAKQP